jgi:hypothetical protein
MTLAALSQLTFLSHCPEFLLATKNSFDIFSEGNFQWLWGIELQLLNI